MLGTRTISLGVLGALTLTAAFAQDWALEKLEKSPRHQEWVDVKHGDRTVRAFVVYPEVNKKVPVIIVIHENQGLTDWVRDLADQVAAAGYIAIAPDLLSGYAPKGGGTSDFPRGQATAAIYKLTPDGVTADLNAVAGYARNIPSADGKIAVTGYCWGGGQSFRFATNRGDLSAAFVFYGTPPDKEAMARIKAPVYGFYGGNDERVDATIPATREAMKELGKTYEPVVYEGAGHGFMRAGEDPAANEGNRKARDEAWARWKKLLAEIR